MSQAAEGRLLCCGEDSAAGWPAALACPQLGVLEWLGTLGQLEQRC